MFKTLQEPNTYQSVHNTLRAMSDYGYNAARQTNQSPFVSAACKEFKLILFNEITAFIGKHTHTYIPQPPPCPLPSVHPLGDVDETRVSKVSKAAFPLTTEKAWLSHSDALYASDTWQLCPASQLFPEREA